MPIQGTESNAENLPTEVERILFPLFNIIYVLLVLLLLWMHAVSATMFQSVLQIVNKRDYR